MGVVWVLFYAVSTDVQTQQIDVVSVHVLKTCQETMKEDQMTFHQ
jgi:hypothetical protein